MLYTKEEIDFEEWDDFVLKQGGTIFSTTSYLQACSENWMVYWEKDNQFGIALPYTEKLGVRTLYQPFFSRYQEFLGQTKDLNSVLNTLKVQFKRSLVALRVANIKEDVAAYTHQVIEKKDRQLSTNAKRQIKKFLKNDYTLTEEVESEQLILLIKTELSKKLAVFSGAQAKVFGKLVNELQSNGYLKAKGIIKNYELVGGVFYMDFGDRVIYLKGACKQQVKEDGGMYYLLNTVIEETLSNYKLFDFGGSRVENVRNFNKKLGGVDQKYLAIHWDNSPIWFKLAQRIRKWIKK